jgi:hypothetical protein
MKFTENDKSVILREMSKVYNDIKCDNCKHDIQCTKESFDDEDCITMLTLDVVETFLTNKETKQNFKTVHVLNFPPEYSIYKNSEFDLLCKAERDCDFSFSNGSVIDLEKYPHLREFCTEQISWSKDLIGKIIKIEVEDAAIVGVITEVFFNMLEVLSPIQKKCYYFKDIKNPEIIG